MRAIVVPLLVIASILGGNRSSAQDARVLEFPRTIAAPGGSLVVHMPQVDEWPDFERVLARAAIEVTLAGADQAVLGSLDFEGDTDTSLEARVVRFHKLRITRITFPAAEAGQAKAMDDFVRATLTKSEQNVPLDVVLSYLDEDVIPTGVSGLSMAAPQIFYSSSDAVLVILDGEPVLVPIAGTTLKFAANTNWDLIFDTAKPAWYLRDDKQWLTMAGETLDGMWAATQNLPYDFQRLPDDGNWSDTKAAIPPSRDAEVPTVFISEQPAELILTKGDPKLEAVGETGLRYVGNTESDVFLLGDTYYYLVSGRWFSAARLEGPWQAVETLPEVFADIPADHPRGDVRVAVPGTDEAKLAVLESEIPRKAKISRGHVPDVQVLYNGEPQFDRVEGTNVYRAVNTQYDVLQVGNTYYLCYNAVWYVSSRPDGAWAVADQIPAELYSIPPSSPAYSVTHVHVYDSDDDVVTTGYTGGYYGVYSYGGVAVYGTGWYYPPYVYYYGYYPYYYWYPRSYGGGAWYNPDTGTYGRGIVGYGPYGGAGAASYYNPQTGSYGRAAAVWDDDEIAGSAWAYNPRSGTAVYTNRYANEDEAWGEALITRDDEWLYTEAEREGDTVTREFESSRGTTGESTRQIEDDRITGSGEISRGDQTIQTEMVRTEEGVARKFTGEDGSTAGFARGSEGDLYAGKDGNVYKREDGEWYQHSGDEWEAIERSERSPGAASDRFDLQPEDFEAARTRAQSPEPTQSYRQFGEPERSVGTPDRSGYYAGDRRSQLDRDYAARRNGYDRYNRMSSRRAAGMGRGGFRGGRRR